uniref:Ubiquitin carboxyl-terminal hydrolase n=1 Tax=Calcidiscus leptoporus TaxID=127549 RepID=A0A7S0P1A7_9EUKA|mmetsp:Transcript_48362/g.111979  ORF Transcript_48362/g.111979 Transcript_48362/m.111979 type:complete len:352 (+) Transcript_48362:24-1079(+)
MSWCTIESDPGVFSELICEMGVKDVQVHELYSLDQEAMEAVLPVHGLIFLFRWRQEKDDRPTVTDYNDEIFFASQMISNACATQAILSILLNRPSLELGEELTALKAFTKDFPPDLKGLAISNSNLLRKVHNSFARPEPFIQEERRATKDDDEVYHFISYLPVNGKLYELDGLKAGPICLGDATEDDWLDVVRPLIVKRIEQYSSREIRFNLMAVTADRRERLLREQVVTEKERNMTVGKVQARSGKLPSHAELEKLAQQHPEPPAMGEVAVDERSISELLIALAHLTARANRVNAQIAMEEQRVAQWRRENVRRRHNYVPFLVNFLKVLAERGELMPLLENAKKKQRAAR